MKKSFVMISLLALMALFIGAASASEINVDINTTEIDDGVIPYTDLEYTDPYTIYANVTGTDLGLVTIKVTYNESNTKHINIKSNVSGTDRDDPGLHSYMVNKTPVAFSIEVEPKKADTIKIEFVAIDNARSPVDTSSINTTKNITLKTPVTKEIKFGDLPEDLSKPFAVPVILSGADNILQLYAFKKEVIGFENVSFDTNGSPMTGITSNETRVSYDKTENGFSNKYKSDTIFYINIENITKKSASANFTFDMASMEGDITDQYVTNPLTLSIDLPVVVTFDLSTADEGASLNTTPFVENTLTFTKDTGCVTAPATNETNKIKKAGYTLTGWTNNSTGTPAEGDLNYTAGSSNMVYENFNETAVTLYPVWTPETHFIDFYDNGTWLFNVSNTTGSDISADLEEGFKNVSKKGYTLNGWLNNTTQESEEVPTIMPAENRKYDADWTVNNYTVSYEFNNTPEDFVTPSPFPADYESTVTAMPSPTIPGYDFEWDNVVPENVSEGTSVPMSTTEPMEFKMPASNVTAKGTFTEQTATITIKGLSNDTEITIGAATGEVISPTPAPTTVDLEITEGNLIISADVSYDDGGRENTTVDFDETNLTVNVADLISKSYNETSKVYENITVTPTSENIVTYNYSAEPTPGGSVDVEVEYVGEITGRNANDTSKTIAGSTATANDGYEFTGWFCENESVSENETFVPEPKDGKYTGGNFVAKFAEIEATITFESCNTTMGNVSIENATVLAVSGAKEGENYSSTAIAADGFHFIAWTVNGTEISTNATLDQGDVLNASKGNNTLYGDVTIVANFAEDEVNISYSSSNETMGTVSPENETVKVVSGNATGSTATANPGYKFVNWTQNGTEVSTNATFIPEKSDGKYVGATYTANFEEADNVTITFGVDGNGSVSSESQELEPVSGTAAPVTASPEPDNYFINWTDEDQQEVSTDATFTPEKNEDGIYENKTYTAHFGINGTVTLKYIANEGGSVNKSSESVLPITGEPEGAEAIAQNGYTFANWTYNGSEISTDAVLTKAVIDEAIYDNETGYINATFEANFVENDPVTITYVSSNETMGSVSLDNESVSPVTGTPEGSNAVAEKGYVFKSWTDENNKVVSTKAEFVPKKVDGVYVEATYTANFEKYQEPEGDVGHADPMIRIYVSDDVIEALIMYLSGNAELPEGYNFDAHVDGIIDGRDLIVLEMINSGVDGKDLVFPGNPRINPYITPSDNEYCHPRTRDEAIAAFKAAMGREPKSSDFPPGWGILSVK